jgi:hypothetical protein
VEELYVLIVGLVIAVLLQVGMVRSTMTQAAKEVLAIGLQLMGNVVLFITIDCTGWSVGTCCSASSYCGSSDVL